MLGGCLGADNGVFDRTAGRALISRVTDMLWPCPQKARIACSPTLVKGCPHGVDGQRGTLQPRAESLLRADLLERNTIRDNDPRDCARRQTGFSRASERLFESDRRG